MHKKLNKPFVSPRLIAKIAIGGFSIHLITMLLNSHFFVYCIPAVVLNIIFISYFLLILYRKNVNATILNIVLFVFLVLTILLLAFTANGNFLASGIWFGVGVTMLDNYLVALVAFLLLAVTLFGIIRKSRLNYSVWSFIILTLILVGFILGILESYLVTPIAIISDLALYVSYVGMTLFLGEYGNAINVRKEIKNA